MNQGGEEKICSKLFIALCQRERTSSSRRLNHVTYETDGSTPGSIPVDIRSAPINNIKSNIENKFTRKSADTSKYTAISIMENKSTKYDNNKTRKISTTRTIGW